MAEDGESAIESAIKMEGWIGRLSVPVRWEWRRELPPGKGSRASDQRLNQTDYACQSRGLETHHIRDNGLVAGSSQVFAGHRVSNVCLGNTECTSAYGR